MNEERNARMIERHRKGVPVATICQEEGVTHTILYEVLAHADTFDRHPRITPWTEDEDRVVIDHIDEAAHRVADMLPGRTKEAVKWRRSQLRKRGDLPPY